MIPDSERDAPTTGTPARVSVRFKFVALGLSLFLATVVAELAVRIIFGASLDTETLQEQNRNMFIGHLIHPVEDPELLYELRTGMAVEWAGVFVKTDKEEPRRISTFIPEPQNAAVRVAVVGDSTTFGWLLDYESVYPEVLRRKLERKLGAPVELRNFSVPGYNTLQERIRFERSVLPWKPDILVLHYDHNDVEPTNTAPPTYIAPEYGDNFLRSALLKFVMRRVRLLRNRGTVHFAEAGELSGMKAFGKSFYEGPLWDAHAAELDRIGRVAAEEGILPVALVFCNEVERSPADWNETHVNLVHRPLRKRLEGAGFFVADMHLPYRERMEKEGWDSLTPMRLSAADGHPNRIGHVFLANRLLEFMESTPALQSRLREAVARSGAVARKVPPSQAGPGEAYRYAINLVDAGKLEEAEKILGLLRRDFPNDPSIGIGYLEILLQSGNMPAAERLAQEMSVTHPDFAQPHKRLGGHYSYTGDHAKAVAHLRIAAEQASNRYVRLHVLNLFAKALVDAGLDAEAQVVVAELREMLKRGETFNSQ